MQMYKGTKSCYVISLSSVSCDPKNYDIISSPEKNKAVLDSVQNVVWYDFTCGWEVALTLAKLNNVLSALF